MVLWIFWKILSLVFLGNNLKWKLILFVDISPPIPYLDKFWSWSYGPKCYQPIKLQDSLNCSISRKKWMIKFIYGMQINNEVFYKLILSFWMCTTRHSLSTQNKNFAYLCNIFRKACGVKLIFLPANKHKSFLQVGSITLVCIARHAPSTQNNKFTISL